MAKPDEEQAKRDAAAELGRLRALPPEEAPEGIDEDEELFGDEELSGNEELPIEEPAGLTPLVDDVVMGPSGDEPGDADLQAGDVDASKLDATFVGEQAPGMGNPTPDQDIVDDIGRAVGVVYQDTEPIDPERKIVERDEHRWELDPASAEDYPARERGRRRRVRQEPQPKS